MISNDKLDAILTLRNLMYDLVHQRIVNKRSFKATWNRHARKLDGDVPLFTNKTSKRKSKPVNDAKSVCSCEKGSRDTECPRHGIPK